jgi:hypothetical protein
MLGCKRRLMRADLQQFWTCVLEQGASPSLAGKKAFTLFRVVGGAAAETLHVHIAPFGV